MEFRWLRVHTSERGSIHPSAIPTQDGSFCLVLQFRELEGPRVEGWWGEWQDIQIEIPE